MSLKMKQYLNFHEKGFINVKRKLQGVCSAVFYVYTEFMEYTVDKCKHPVLYFGYRCNQSMINDVEVMK